MDLKKRGPSSPAEQNVNKKSDGKSSPNSTTLNWEVSTSAGRSSRDNNNIETSSTPEELYQNPYSQQRVNDSSANGLALDRHEPELVQQEHLRNTGPNQTQPIFSLKNEGAMREEIEIEIQTINDKPFKCSITFTEAKHSIFKEALGFCDFRNFDGVRFGFKGIPLVIFKLKTPINVDELLCVQFFEFSRNYKRQGKDCTDIIKCKIRGLRAKQDSGPVFSDSYVDDGVRIVKIEGCDYRVPEQEILAWLELYGVIRSELVEDCYFTDDGDSDGTNRTGVYSVKMEIHHDIPQLLPMSGKRIRVYYKSIQKLCTNCFGPHPKRVCRSQKRQWLDYVEQFIEKNPEIEPVFFGKWWDQITKKREQEKDSETVIPTEDQETVKDRTEVSVTNEELDPTVTQGKQSAQTDEPETAPADKLVTALATATLTEPRTEQNPPTAEDFGVPANQDQFDKMVEKMMSGGAAYSEACFMIEKRKTAFNKASREYKRDKDKLSSASSTATRANTKARKDSLNK